MTYQISNDFNNIAFAQNIISGLGFIPVNFYFPGVNPHMDSCIAFGLKKFSNFSSIEEQVLFFYDDGDMKAPNKGFLLTTRGMHILGYPWFIPMERFTGANIQLTRSQFGFDLNMYYQEGISPASDTYKIYVPNDMLIPVLRMVFQQLGSKDPMAPIVKSSPVISMASRSAINCPSCKAPAKAGQKFCMSCGAAITTDRPTARTKKFCTECGAKLLPGAKFCQSCGTKMYTE